jgi:squalene-associated FAD-dependent desaturase
MRAVEANETESRARHRPDPPRVVIVGGGLAGLAAAVALRGAGVKLTLLESRPRLGGRASSFTDPVTGELVDNCQHVSMGCCTNLADFCRRVGTDNLFRRVPEILFLDPEGRLSRWKADRLWAPLHLTRSFLSSRFLTAAEKLRVAWGLARLRFAAAGEARTFAEWLQAHGQTARTIDRFWATVLVSALNERLDRVDVGQARKVFLDGFLRNRGGYALEVPTVPLGELYGERLEAWLAGHSVEVRLRAGARRVVIDEERAVAGVEQRNGEVVPADFVVLAVPFDRVGDLVPESARERISALALAKAMDSTPITGIHLWLDREVCPHQHVVVIGRTIQWVFNHTALQGRREPVGGGQYLQLVVSAAYDLVDKPKGEILEIALCDLRAMWPAARQARVERWWVVTEHGATFSVRPGIDAKRPRARTEIDGLFLAGDWTATGWPATMEGAVRSGYAAAEQLLVNLDRPTRILVDELPTEPLAALLLGPQRRRQRRDPQAVRRV